MEHVLSRFALGTSHRSNVRSFSPLYSPKGGGGGGEVNMRRALPWLDHDMADERKRSGKVSDPKANQSSWDRGVGKEIHSKR
ncbi:hypothetical protein Ancab_016874 [Ancistrocladus abbreviatus]